MRLCFALVLSASLFASIDAVAEVATAPAPAIEGAEIDAVAVERLAGSIRNDVTLAAKAEPTTRIVALRSALASLTVLEQAARRPVAADEHADATTRAKAALEELAKTGFGREAISAQAIAAAVSAIEPSKVSAEDLTAAYAELDRLAIDIASPGLKADAMISIGRMHRRFGNTERATRYGQLAERASRAIARGDERDALLVGALDLFAVTDLTRSLGVIVTTLAGFSDGERRAKALTAMASKVGGPVDGSNVAVWRAVAVGDDSVMETLMSAAAASGDDDDAVLLAAARRTASGQDAALITLARDQLERGRAAASLDTVRLVLGADRARVEAEIALALAGAGYISMSASVLDSLAGAAESDPEVARLVASARETGAAPRAVATGLQARLADIRGGDGDPDERERAATAVANSAKDLAGALTTIRALADDRIRVAAFRAVAEQAAASLGGDRLVKGTVTPSGRGEPGARGRQLFATKGLALLSGDAIRGEAPAFLPVLPDVSATAGAVRAEVPLSNPGVGELSLAGLNRFTQLNRFNSKFLEDVVGTTAREHILKTQGTINPTFIYLTDGVFTARDLLHLIDTSQGEQLVRKEGIYTLRVPLVVGQDATLVLSGLDSAEFRLSADAGAFLINAGKLFIVDTKLTGWSEAKGAPVHATYETKHEFRPFVTTWSGSETYIAGSTVTSLGYSAGKSYGLTFSSGPKDSKGITATLPRPKGLVVDTVFRNLYYGFYTYEADDVAAIGNVYDDSVVYGLDPHDRSNRLVMAFNTLYGTQEKHGAIFSRDVKDSVLWGNVSFANAGSGFMLDRRSTRSLVWANTAIGNVQDGMTVYETPCVLIGANRFEANGRSGIKIRNSWNVLVDDNLIVDNAGTGLEAYVADLADTEDGAARDLHEDPYLAISTFSASGNDFSGKAVAVSARGIAGAALSGNRFKGQGAAVFDGDLKPVRANLLRASAAGRAATVLAASFAAPSAEDSAGAGTPDCPPPQGRPAMRPGS